MSNTVEAGVIETILRLRDELTPALGRAVSGLQQSGAKMTAVGSSLLPISGAFALAGLGAVKFATDLNAVMANVSTIVPGGTARILEMKTEVQSLAIEMGKGTTDMAEGLYDLVSTLGDTADTMPILAINAKAAAAGLATTKDAILLTTAVTKTYGDTSQAAFQKVSDLAFQTVNLGVTTFPELAAAIGSVAPLAKETGVSMEEMFSVVATATGITGNTAEVMTQMSAAIVALMSPSDQLKEIYKSLGAETGEAMIAEYGLVGSLQAVSKGAKDAGVPLIDLLGRKEAWIITSALAGSQADSFSSKMTAMANVAGATDAAFEKQTTGINAAGFSWEQLKSKVLVAAQTFGDTLLPILMRAWTQVSPLVDQVLGLAQSFGNLPQPVQTVVVALGALLAVASPALLFFGALAASASAAAPFVVACATAVGLMAPAATAAIPPVVGLTGATRGLTAAMLANPWTMAMLALGGLAVAYRAAAKAVDEHTDAERAAARQLTYGQGTYGLQAQALDRVTDAHRKMIDELNRTAAGPGAHLNQYQSAEQAAASQAAATAAILDTLATKKRLDAQLTEEQADAIKRQRAEIVALAATYTGAAMAAEIDKIAKAVAEAGRRGGLSDFQYKSLGETLSQKVAQGAVLADAALHAIWLKHETLNPSIAVSVNSYRDLAAILDKMPSYKLSMAPPPIPFKVTEMTGADWQRILNLGKIGPLVKAPAAAAGFSFADSFAKALDGLGSVVIGALQGGGSVGRSVGASVGASIGADLAKNILGESTSKLLKGALSFLGPLGALAGSALGGLIGGLFGPSKGMKELLAANAEIQKMRDELLKTYGSLQNIGKLDKALGTDVAAGWMHQGKAGAAAFAKSMAELQARLAAVKKEMSGISAGSGDLLSLAGVNYRNSMPDDADVQAFAVQQVQAAGSAAAAMLDAIQRASTASARATIAAQIALTKEAILSASGSMRDELEKQLEDLEAQSASVRGQMSLTAGGAAAMAGMLLAAWDGTAQGLRNMAPDIALLQQALADSGLTGSTSFTALADMAALAAGEISGPLLEAINYGTAALTAMYNAGFLTQETFQGMVDEIMAQRAALLATGATADTVNAAMRADLQRIWELTQDGKYAIDEKTQALIDEAVAAGTVGDKFRSTEDRMLIALEKIAKMFETVFADTLTSAAQRGAAAAERALRGIPTDFDVTFTYQTRNGNGQGPGGGQGGPGGGGSGGGSGNPPGFRTGTQGRYVDFGAGTSVILHGRERVMPEGEASGSVSVTINNPHVRDDRDIYEIARQVMMAIPRRYAVEAGRR